MYGAAVRHSRVVRDNRDGRKAPDALLKLSMTTKGQKGEACRLLDFLPQEYPTPVTMFFPERTLSDASCLFVP